ncbi:MAG: VIT and vWA domain-containing protein [Planctomycetota bacterium]|jgi:Ca-activated chloride channel family protein
MLANADRWMLGTALALLLCPQALGSGTLIPLGSPEDPIQILDHHVDVVINNGFARTEVTQTFFNPNAVDLEAIYSFPVPRSASLSEFSIYVGETEIHGEVLTKEEARRIYGEEKDKGNDAGLAEKNSFYTYEFYVSPVRAADETRVRFLYHQPIEIDTGMGRYVYPLQEGGTDDAALQFWTTNEVVEGTFSLQLELKSAWPVSNVRVPGFEAEANVQETEDGRWVMTMERTDATLDRDLVFYYKLADDLPGRVELLTYRADENSSGTFMMILTPGLDLQPVIRGADYVFVLDVSGSMDGGKIRTLARGVSQAMGELNPDDRYRIVVFSSSASELTRGWVSATPENVQRTISRVESLNADGSTNLYAGLGLGLKRLDDDRVTSLILVTDAVTNTGVVDPKAFHALMKKYDLRVFGFLMGNSANWPLMRTIADASGGFYARVSTADDIIGQIVLAKSKITHECLHDANLKIEGVDVWGTTGEMIGKVYRGQQLVIFGRYDKPGEATVTLGASLSGQDKTYTTAFSFPQIDRLHPELERLWALDRIEDLQTKMDAGLTSPGETEQIITGLGVDYQIVTDYTSMVVLSDEAFAQRGIERRNQGRIALEREARAQRARQPVASPRVDQNRPMFQHRSPSSGSGGPALDPITGLIGLGLGGLSLAAARRRKHGRPSGAEPGSRSGA